MASYNLSTVVDFPTRITENPSTAIDNIFIDKIKNRDYTVKPIINGLPDHDAQELVLHNVQIINRKTQFIVNRLINDITITQFKLNLSYENWSDTFTEEDVDTNFRNFLSTYLRNFYHGFPYKKVHINPFQSNFSANHILRSSYLLWAGKRLVDYLLAEVRTT